MGGHVHTFYGPKDIHPNTSYEDLLNAPPDLSTSQVEENQSLYWHPSIYIEKKIKGVKHYNRISHTRITAYYRWDRSLVIQAFPPGFRMIAGSTDNGANIGGPTGGNLYTECCNFPPEEEEGGSLDCVSYDNGTPSDLFWPKRKCDFLDIVFAMPICWNGSNLGDTNNHKNHMKYTLDGTVFGTCPSTHQIRLPQIQLFVNIQNYNGIQNKYVVSDSTNNWHIDFFNGWEETKLQEIIDNCEVLDPQQPLGEINPATGCTPQTGDERFLTASEGVEGSVCDLDLRKLIIDEATDKVKKNLPSGSCTGTLKPKSWTELTSNLFMGSCNREEACTENKKKKFIYIKPNKKKFKKQCTWLANNKKKGQKNWKKICKQVGESNKAASKICPITCETCGFTPSSASLAEERNIFRWTP